MSRKTLLEEFAATALTIAADFRPDPKESYAGDPVGVREWVRGEVLTLADELHGSGVTLKVNSALRTCGYPLITEIQDRGLRVFADMKFFDISETLSIDGALLSVFKPDVVTVVCAAGTKALKALKEGLPDSEVIGITVPTSFSETDAMEVYGLGVLQAVGMLAEVAKEGGLDGLVSSSKEVPHLVSVYGQSLSYTVAGIRPDWFLVQQDDQNPDRSATPMVAIARGAKRLVIGRPITKSSNRREAVERTIKEMTMALEKLESSSQGETC